MTHPKAHFTAVIWDYNPATAIWCVTYLFCGLAWQQTWRDSAQNANMLKYLAAHDGRWTAESYATNLMLDFGPGSDYDQFGQLEGGIDKYVSLRARCDVDTGHFACLSSQGVVARQWTVDPIGLASLYQSASCCHASGQVWR